jgi:hypothetical protein
MARCIPLYLAGIISFCTVNGGMVMEPLSMAKPEFENHYYDYTDYHRSRKTFWTTLAFLVQLLLVHASAFIQPLTIACPTQISYSALLA